MRPLLFDPIGPWHRWFAWRPVDTITHGWRWLVHVDRRRYQFKGSPAFHTWYYQPRAQ